MRDDPNRPPEGPSSSDTQRPEPQPGAAGSLPPPPGSAADHPPTPESQAALTGKAPSGSSQSGTTVPASTGDPSRDPAPTGEAAGGAGPQPPGGASPSIGDPLKNPSQADAEKAARIAEAKARAAAAKQAAGDKPAPPAQPGPASGATSGAGSGAASATTGGGAPKAPVKKKEEGPKPTDASDHPLARRLAGAASGAVLEASEFIGQLSMRIERTRILEVCRLLRDDPSTPFNYLTDVTCVHLPERSEAPFEVVYNLYSIPANTRVRLKVATSEEEGVESVTGLWPAANWMEREVFDLFGVPFRNHPDLRRILLPQDWEGHPLRKDYPLEFMENNWTARHLPEFTEVQKEQLIQRRAYGLEMLHVPAERHVREIFRAGKEVMPKNK